VGAAATDAEPDPESVARTVALNLLNHSARSRAQLAEAMARKDVPEAVADRVLDRFEEVGLVDDAEYAAMLVRTRQAERGLARRALTVELERKGIVGEAAANALSTVVAEDEEEAARRVVEKRLRSMTTLETEVKRRRLVAMLARKGHAPGMSYRVVDEALRSDAS
jgi:regulatory protein